MAKKIERVSLVGLGAIGAAYGSRIYDLDPNCIQVIANQERIDRYRAEGLTVNGKSYAFRYVTPEDQVRQPADLVLVAVKYSDLDQAILDLKHHIGPDTIIMSLMNGIASEEKLKEAYKESHILYAICLAIDAVRVGRDVKFGDIGRICFGDKLNEVYSDEVQAVIDFFDTAQVPYEVPTDMLQTLWWKFMINVGVNQPSAVLKAPYGVFQQIPEAYDIAKAAMLEVVRLAQKQGVNLTDSDIARFEPVLKGLSPEGKTSMLQDIEAGRKTEVDYMAGTVCELGFKHGVPTPVNNMLMLMIRTLEQMNDQRASH